MICSHVFNRLYTIIEAQNIDLIYVGPKFESKLNFGVRIYAFPESSFYVTLFALIISRVDIMYSFSLNKCLYVLELGLCFNFSGIMH